LSIVIKTSTISMRRLLLAIVATLIALSSSCCVVAQTEYTVKFQRDRPVASASAFEELPRVSSVTLTAVAPLLEHGIYKLEVDCNTQQGCSAVRMNEDLVATEGRGNQCPSFGMAAFPYDAANLSCGLGPNDECWYACFCTFEQPQAQPLQLIRVGVEDGSEERFYIKLPEMYPPALRNGETENDRALRLVTCAACRHDAAYVRDFTVNGAGACSAASNKLVEYSRADNKLVAHPPRCVRSECCSPPVMPAAVDLFFFIPVGRFTTRVSKCGVGSATVDFTSILFFL
jgi:hypothetical protein